MNRYIVLRVRWLTKKDLERRSAPEASGLRQLLQLYVVFEYSAMEAELRDGLVDQGKSVCMNIKMNNERQVGEMKDEWPRCFLSC